VQRVVLGIHQEGERHLEASSTSERLSVSRWLDRSAPPSQDTKAAEGQKEIEMADRIDQAAIEADLLLGLAQRGGGRRRIARLDLAARKCDLPGMARGPRCAASAERWARDDQTTGTSTAAAAPP